MNGSSTKEEASPPRPKWRKVAYGGMQLGYDDNYKDDTFLENTLMNTNVIKRDFFKLMLDSIFISQYISVVTLVILVWIHSLDATIDVHTLLLLDVSLLGLGFLVLLLTDENCLQRVCLCMFKVAVFASGLYLMSPVYQTLTRTISSDSIWAVAGSLLMLHLFLHEYSGTMMRANAANPSLMSCVSLNSAVVASVFIASRLHSRLHVFAVVLLSLQVFIFAPRVGVCVKKCSMRLHLALSLVLVAVTLVLVYAFQRLFFVFLLSLFVFVMVACPYWLIRIQEYKFEINGPWDEAKLCFDITE